MEIALFGASGTIGQRILNEALSRGHQVTAIVRDSSRVATKPGVIAVSADIQDASRIATVVVGHDAVVSAYGPGHDDPKLILSAVRSLLKGLPQAGVKRLFVSGGAGSLEVAPGLQLVDAPGFPAAWKGLALAWRDALEIMKKEAAGLDWTYGSPAAYIQPGERTGKFRLGTDQLITDPNGESRISDEDWAIAVLDELEKPQFIGRRFTAAY